ncbi:protein of unknown function [Lutibacter oricola]|uniref:Uncharacterized protein n=1 Tax=Lutibacter oricola TaxID=762486 RepID=A0A1H2YWM6_9FLAO|nr:DUF4173 domain-containing protein [Lutibacter oricola]SDX09445.1 protein of unknown function [Lutibacter oricola]
MKKIITLISAITFSLLFFQQSVGLNLLLFTITTIISLAIVHPSKINNKTTIWYSVIYLLTGIAVFFQKSDLTIIANLISFFTVVGAFSENRTSIYINWINGLYSCIVSVFAIYFEKQNSNVISTSNTNNQKKFVSNLKITIPTIIVVVVFIVLYSKGNPVFSDLLSKIDLSFINFKWILFTGLGYYLFNNILNPIKIEPATNTDLTTGNLLLQNKLKETSTDNLKNENKLATVLILTLNVLIILFLVTDFVYISKLHYLSAAEISKQVHNGVYTLIISIVLAIAIILYFFRGHLNFYKENKKLKTLTIVWIVLNLLLSVSTSIKNIEYITSFGLTYKRIGVLIYLLLAISGLITTFIKVNQQKNIWYLFRQNATIAFSILVMFSFINWDAIISKYNLYTAEVIDMEYLLNLSNNNTFALKAYIDKGNNVSFRQQEEIESKHANYVSQLKRNSWQEMVADNLTIE